jgi:hypothetical protein
MYRDLSALDDLDVTFLFAFFFISGRNTMSYLPRLEKMINWASEVTGSSFDLHDIFIDLCTGNLEVRAYLGNYKLY